MNFCAAYLFTSDNANLLDVARSCKVGRFSAYFLELSAVVRIVLRHDLSARHCLRRLDQPTRSCLPGSPLGVQKPLKLWHFGLGRSDGAGSRWSRSAHGVPVKLLANRLASESGHGHLETGRTPGARGDIRDAYHLTPPGEARGPDGDLLAFWRKRCVCRLNGQDWHDGLRDLVGRGRSPTTSWAG